MVIVNPSSPNDTPDSVEVISNCVELLEKSSERSVANALSAGQFDDEIGLQVLDVEVAAEPNAMIDENANKLFLI
ncbi:unnamed protein product [Debaryomyces fabryi]|nr:unnamed protein product [Debaryomyces fabryi]